jgi:hypothetical protein
MGMFLFLRISHRYSLDLDGSIRILVGRRMAFCYWWCLDLSYQNAHSGLPSLGREDKTVGAQPNHPTYIIICVNKRLDETRVRLMYIYYYRRREAKASTAVTSG